MKYFVVRTPDVTFWKYLKINSSFFKNQFNFLCFKRSSIQKIQLLEAFQKVVRYLLETVSLIWKIMLAPFSLSMAHFGNWIYGVFSVGYFSMKKT